MSAPAAAAIEKMPYVLGMAGAAVVLTFVIPFMFRGLQKWQRARGETPVSVVGCVGALIVLALIAYGSFWMLTQS